MEENTKNVTQLIAALGDKNKSVRRTAVEALAKIGAPAVPVLIEAIRSGQSQRIRANARNTLSQIKDPAAVPQLMAILKKDKDKVTTHLVSQPLKMMREERK